MTLYEYAGNMHMHTPYSDGEASHAQIAQAAIAAGLDFVIVTDHNVLVEGVEGYYEAGPGKKVLLLTGEEVHNTRRDPQRNHLLIYNTGVELSSYAANPQELIDKVKEHEGFCYLAHPIEVAAPLFHEPEISWVNWEVSGYTGIELWNYMSEFKTYLDTRLAATRAAFNPDQYISGPLPRTLSLWDKLLAEGKVINIIGNSDAHGTRYSMGPISRVIFPYEFLFRCVNTHILSTQPFAGDIERDSQIVYQALKNGHAFVGYDFPAPTKGFRFSAQGHNASTIMGGKVRLGHGVTIQIASPQVADIRLIKDGEVIHRETEGTHTTHIALEPGVYRVEIYIDYKGKSRGWIFSNPIYVIE